MAETVCKKRAVKQQVKIINVFRPSGKTFEVHPQNVHISLSVGDIVTFLYESQLRKDTSDNAIIYRIRRDVDWVDVVNQYHRDKKYIAGMKGMEGFVNFINIYDDRL
jgi:hypothetical protein